MPNYHRIHAPGGTYFFTVVTNERLSIFSTESSIILLLNTIEKSQNEYPFEQIAYCIMPDHIHCIWKLPDGDDDYSRRWQLIKARFSREFFLISDLEGKITESRKRKREKGIWQRRFWEHIIRDDNDLAMHINYIHFNPIKHGLVKRLSDWSWSSYNEYLSAGYYDASWGETEPKDIGKLGLLE
jgi:putative transposase